MKQLSLWPVVIFLAVIIAATLLFSTGLSTAENKVEKPDLKSLIGKEVRPDESPYPVLLKIKEVRDGRDEIYADVIVLLPQGSTNPTIHRIQNDTTGGFSDCGFYIQFEIGKEGQTWTFENCLKYQGSDVRIVEIRYRDQK